MTLIKMMNRALGLLTCALFVAALLAAMAPHQTPLSARPSPLAALCKNLRLRVSDPLSKIELASSLFLRCKPPSVHLPDLRGEVVLLGVNRRPDADPRQQVIHLLLNSSQESFSLPVLKRAYLKFERTGLAGSYALSSDEVETNLWISPNLTPDGEVSIDLAMRSQGGEVIAIPSEHAHFTVKERAAGFGERSFMLGSHRVDSGLLARLRARWFGQDLFLTDHGGEEYPEAKGRERIDFGEGEECYSCFVAAGDSLVWKGNKWHNLKDGESSDSYPLLYVSKVGEKQIAFDLWDPEGKAALPLVLMRGREMWMPPYLKDLLRFVAAKTWSQFVLIAAEERLIVSPSSWLLLTEKGWQEIKGRAEIDDFIAGRLSGELLVLNGIGRREGRQVLKGHLYNTSRSEMQDFEMPLTPQLGPIAEVHKRSSHEERPHLFSRTLGGSLNERTSSDEQSVGPSQGEADEPSLLSLPAVIRGLTEEADILSDTPMGRSNI